MNARLLAAMPIAEILVCYEDGDDCPRRKPNPGLLLEAAETHAIDLRPASWSATAGATSRPAGAPAAAPSSSTAATDERRPDPPADHDAADLSDAADWILSDLERRTTA